MSTVTARKPQRPRRASRTLPSTLGRIVIADNDSLFRVGLREMALHAFPSASVAEANSGESLEATLAAQRADLALIDLGLPGLHGYLSVLRLVQRHPKTRFVAVSGLEVPLAAPRVLAMGVAGYVSKRASHERIERAMVTARRTPWRLPPREKKLVEGLQRLTPTEAHMFALLPDNPSHRSLMEAMGIALPTVKTHMSRILAKLDLRHRTEAAIVAKRLSVFSARALCIERAAG